MKTKFYVHFTDADGAQRILGRCFSLRDGIDRINAMPFIGKDLSDCWIGEYRDGQLVTRHESSMA